jgi:ectoine hydroxylase-related dioxygenase (phytanoyl-CoA dioxygenase family)
LAKKNQKIDPENMSYSHPFSWTPAPFTVFKKPEIKQKVEEFGFAVVDLFEPSTIDAMRSIYKQEHQLTDEKGGMFYSVYSQDVAYRTRIHEALKNELTPVFEENFTDYNNGLNFFINKLSGEDSAFSIHQDSSAIDEFKHSSLSVWIPLQDVDETNGALWIAEKTHQLFSPYRSVSFSPPFSNIKDTIKEYLKPVHLKKGQALIFDARIIHTSGKNTSGKDRLAVVSGILPNEATFQLSFQDKEDGPIEIYQQADDFLINYPNFFQDCILRPTIGEKIDEGKFVFPKITAKQFESDCELLGIEKVSLFTEGEPVQNFITEPITETPLVKAKFAEYNSQEHEAIRMFKDDELERQLCEEGYVIIPFFNDDEVAALLDYFTGQNKEDAKAIFAISHSEDIELKTSVKDWVANLYTPRVEELFVDTQILGGTFVAKPPNGKGLITPHRDWNLVDERRFRSCNIWVPLVDTTAENGAIEILPKSHLIQPTYRGPNIVNQLREVEDFLWKNLELKPMKAGHAFVYDHRFIHGSRNNNSTTVRPASACAITNINAEFRFYHIHKTPFGKQTEEFSSYPNYLLREDRFDYPTTIDHIQTIHVDPSPYDESHFNGLNLGQGKPAKVQEESGGLLNKLKSFFKA